MNQATMTPERWKRMETLFAAALELPKDERAKFLADQCGGDLELQEEAEKLLEAHYQTAESWEQPLAKFPRAGFPMVAFLAEGRLLLDRFKIVRRVGSGGMGDVYEATDLELGRIALKTIRPDIAQNAAILARFKSEVKLARSIRGPNVCHIYELYVPPKESGCPCSAFLTMEFLDGVTLAKRIATDGPMAPKEALKVAAQLCAALQSIHEAGVVHRDLKPGNIMLVPRNGSEQAVVMDFGLARALSPKSPPKSPIDAPGQTVLGGIMGTPAYMAPEQFEGGEVSSATDIYALGLVLYELITGQQPFAAPTPFGAAIRHGRRPDSPSSVRKGVPPIWDDVIARCMEYDPERRYQSAGEVIEALKQYRLFVWRFSRGQRIALTPRVAAIAGAVLFVLLSISGWSVYRAVTTYRPSPAAKKWYDEGVAALRDGTYLKAANSLAEAVKSDPRYALAHARLADAWAELDSTGQAQQEMLLATDAEQKTSLPQEDKQYVDAVQATLIRNYSAAAQDYEDILKNLPADRRADGLVDLGRAYEKAGKIKETITQYEQAAKENPDDPAPFVHIGIWKSRQRDPVGAEKAFTQAEKIYTAKSNQEGLAEVDYQRGYAANGAGDPERALVYLGKSLATARQISSPQLEARTLTQLSSIEYNGGKEDKGIEDASRAIKIASDNNLEYWYDDGEMRLGNAYLHKGDLKNAESYTQDALRLARQNRHPRLEADAMYTLASIRYQQGKWDEEIALARAALKYFEDFGFAEMAASASTLIVMGELGEGNLSAARKDSVELVHDAEAANSRLSLEYAEDTAGSVSFSLEDYPDALRHYEHALDISRIAHENQAIQQISCADALWRLGRYDEAESTLEEIPHDVRQRADISLYIQVADASMRLSQDRYREAIEISTKALNSSPDIAAGQAAELRVARALAEGRLGQSTSAHLDADRLLKLGKDNSDEGIASQAELATAELFLWENHPEKAVPLLEAANQYFSRAGMKESEWKSLYLLAKVNKESGNKAGASQNAAKALDILRNLEQSWGSSAFAQYSSRPDNQIEMRELSHIV